MQVSSLGFATDLMIRRLSGSAITEVGSHVVVQTPSNPAYHWGNFILALEDAANAPRWLAAFRAAHPDAKHVAIGLDVPAVDGSLRVAYHEVGLEVDVSEVLTAQTVSAAAHSIECAPLADDRAWDEALRLTLETHEITDPVEVEFATRKQAEMRGLVEAGYGAWFGAFVDGHVRATLGVLTEGSGLGRYQSVETHPDYRRRGLARALLTSAASVLQSNYGVREFVIVADPEYHAAGLYRAVGFSPVGIQVQVGLSSV